MAKKVPKTIKNAGREYFKTISTMLTGAFGLVAALAWNELVKGLIDRYLSTGNGLISQFIYALIVTTLLIIVTVEMGKVAKKFDNEEANSNE